MTDLYQALLDRERELSVAVVVTTEVCRAARAAHQLDVTSCLALGRLLTATALCGLTQKRGTVSVQVIGDGKLGQAFADVTQTGELRGYVKNPSLAFPVAPDEDPRGRRRIGHAVGQGLVSVIRLDAKLEYCQSTTKLVSGEIDEDVARYLEQSDQIGTVMLCDLLLGDTGEVSLAGGLLAQQMPDSDREDLETVRNAATTAEFIERLRQYSKDPVSLARWAVPGAEPVGTPVPIQWQCRCSYERVLGGLRILDAGELAQMVDTREPAIVSCDFCGKTYEVAAAVVEQVFLDTITAQG